MLSFFGKIRRGLITGSGRKYFLYALGEILLIVIGILIALQINNWNQRVIDKTKRHQVLDNLKKELIFTDQRLDNSLKLAHAIADCSVQILNMMAAGYQPYSNRQVDSVVYIFLSSPSLEPATGALLSVINTGQLNLIRNDSLKEMISSWYDMLNDIALEERRIQEFLSSSIVPFLYDKFSMSNMDRIFSQNDRKIPASSFNFENRKILDEAIFENLVDDQLYRVSNLITEYEDLKGDIDQFMRLIAEEINS